MSYPRLVRNLLAITLIILTSINVWAFPSLIKERPAETPTASPRVQTGQMTAAVSEGLTSYVVNHSGEIGQGAIGLGEAINRLGVVASALHTGAHPDDEDSGLLAYLARRRQARTAYLSLTRGDGGQNLIGPELYESLGVIRTEELLAARRMDGAKQLFTRAFDFGFSKSREEALSNWDRDAVLADMVRAIRLFRPLVIVSAWSGTDRDGHGHHQAAGYLTPEAYRAAADPSRYPDQIAAGLKPWKAKKLYASARRFNPNREDAEPVTLSLNTGEFDPLFGRSFFELAARGRSQHRSQDMGGIERRGPAFSRLRLLDSSVGTPKEEKDIFEGMDTSLTGIAAFAGRAADKLKPALMEIQKTADEARQKYNPFSPSRLSPVIASGLKKIRELRSQLSSLGLSEAEKYDTDFLLMEKEKDFADALIKVESVVLDCLVDDEVVTPGQTFKLSVASYSNSMAKPVNVSMHLAKGLVAAKGKESDAETEGRLVTQTEFTITAGRDVEMTEPYWLKQPRRGDMFVTDEGWTGVEPFTAPPVVAVVTYQIEGQKVAVAAPAQYRYADKSFGEIRRELKIAPAVSVALSPEILISPISDSATEREVTVSLSNNSKEGVSGKLALELPSGWKSAPAEAAFDLKRQGERASYSFKVQTPARIGEGRYEIKALASAGDRRFSRGYQAISYPHIETRFVYKDATTIVEVFDVRVAPDLTVGYIEGAGDDFADALKRLGANVEMISSRGLESGDLSRYDVIVTGVRAYEVRPDLAANNRRLLDYVKEGGTFIVQYNKSEYAAGNFAPYPVKMGRSNSRVTDEHAAITLLEPNHPLFNFPNKITKSDFDGWVQERGAYFLNEWDERYKPLMASNDAGEDPQRGGQVIAEYGKGLYVYTAYGWYRQLPRGVPGAYRLIANLVSLPKAKR